MNKNKKKMLAIALLLFASIGFAGYGVYSYYWTKGDFTSIENDSDHSTDQNVIFFTDQSFDPQATYSGESLGFMGNGGSFSVTCSDINSDGNTYCSGSTTVKNNGTSCIYVEVREAGTYVENNGSPLSESPSLSWTSTYLKPGDSTELVASGGFHFNDAGDATSSEPVEVTEPVSGLSDTVKLYYQLYATQAYSGYCNY